LFRYVIAFALTLILVALTRGNHATLALAVFASVVFVIAADIAERLSKLTPTGRALKAVAFVGCAGAAGLVSALVISLAYDHVVGPDPLRFSLAMNIAMDTAVVALLMGIMRAAISIWALRKFKT
jgi:hypothetical protein